MNFYENEVEFCFRGSVFLTRITEVPFNPAVRASRPCLRVNASPKLFRAAFHGLLRATRTQLTSEHHALLWRPGSLCGL